LGKTRRLSLDDLELSRIVESPYEPTSMHCGCRLSDTLRALNADGWQVGKERIKFIIENATNVRSWLFGHPITLPYIELLRYRLSKICALISRA
jgi:hypothetical protein